MAAGLDQHHYGHCDVFAVHVWFVRMLAADPFFWQAHSSSSSSIVLISKFMGAMASWHLYCIMQVCNMPGLFV